MESLGILFKQNRVSAGKAIGLLFCWLMITTQAIAQVYTAGYSGTAFNYFDVTSHTWTAKANAPEALYDITSFQGKIYGIASGTSNFYQYDPATNTWTQKAAALAGLTAGHLVAAGNYIYANAANGSQFERYDPATNAWTQLAATPTGTVRRHMAYDGGDYIYLGYSQGTNVLARYSISGNTWTTMPSPPSGTNGVVIRNGKLYFTDAFVATFNFNSFNPATSAYSTLANAPVGIWTIIGGDGNYLYGTPNDFSALWQYDISTNTWTSYTGGSDYALAYEGCSVTASVVAAQATCGTNGGVNANASLTLASYSSGATKVGYSIGSGYTGPDYSSATPVTSAPMTIGNNLTNPTADQPYTVRVFTDATCYQDILVILKPQVCLTSDISVAVSPTTQTNAASELQTYTVTVTNAGPDASAVKLKVPIPINRTFVNASPQQGTYDASTKIWDVGNLAVGSKTLKLTIKVN